MIMGLIAKEKVSSIVIRPGSASLHSHAFMVFLLSVGCYLRLLHVAEHGRPGVRFVS
jgi:hypothetical protein